MNKVFKAILFCAVFCLASMLSAVSYTDNTYQKLSEEYLRQAEQAKRAGDYKKAIELSEKAKENAELSKEFIDMMLSRGKADEQLAAAEERMEWADENDIESRYPDEYSKAQESYDNALSSYDEENFDAAELYALRCLEELEGLEGLESLDAEETAQASDEEGEEEEEAGPLLPEYYIVGDWKTTKDCFWNIAAKPFVYNNPALWKHLYNANKDNLPRPNNPNLLRPGMKMLIPSINGEEREDVYDPKKEYGTYGEE